MGQSFGWLEVRLIGELLAERHPKIDPLSVRFVDLRRMVQELPGFKEEAGHPVNEKILETIQKNWYEEAEDLKGDEDDDDEGGH
jgi:FeS assembly protein IscX